MATPIRGRGLVRHDPEQDAHRLLAAKEHPAIAARLAADRLGHADLTAFEPPIFDQGPTLACTSHSMPGGIVTAFAAAGTPLKITSGAKRGSPFIPSPRQLYAATRAIARARSIPSGLPLPALTDAGATLPDVVNAGALFGVSPMGAALEGRVSDLAESNVNLEPDSAALEQAATRIITGEYLIAVDDTVADVAAAALEAGLPVWVGFFADSAFESLPAGQIAGAPHEPDPNGGGHAVVLVGYQTMGGARVFTIRNSWGTGWGNAGRGLVSEAWLRAAWAAYPLQVARASVISSRPGLGGRVN